MAKMSLNSRTTGQNIIMFLKRYLTMDFPERNALHSDLETNLIQKLEFFDDGPIDKTLA